MDEDARQDEIQEFVLDNYPPAHQSSPEKVGNWTGWAAHHGFLFLGYDKEGDDGKLVALGIARPLSLKRTIEEITDTDFDRDGEVVYVDLTISTTGKSGMQAIMLAILNRMGDKPLLAFKRLKTQNKYNIYRLRDFASKLLRGKQ
jgi:hypothetical protein